MTPPPPIDEHLEAGAEGAVHGAILGSIARLRDTNVAKLLNDLRTNDADLATALAHLDLAHERIARLIASNRGSLKGMHGFIAEILEVGIENARAAIRNGNAQSVWVNDNGAIDILRAGVAIQQKFYSGPMSRILRAITDHAATYSDYVAQGGLYQIPKDQYETLQSLLRMSEHEASTTLVTGGTGPSFRDWKAVHEFVANSGIPINRIEASTITRAEAEAKVAPATVLKETRSIRSTHAKQESTIREAHRPTPRTGLHAAAASAAFEGGFVLARAIRAKLRSGTRLEEFTPEDWSEVLAEAGIGATRGFVRGGVLYVVTASIPETMTNSSPIAAMASAVVTAAFAIAEQTHRYRAGEITPEEFGDSCLRLSVDTSLQLVATLMGQALIPVPLLGSIIGSAVGAVLSSLAHEYLDESEQRVIDASVRALDAQRARLAEEERESLARLEKNLRSYILLLEQASVVDPLEAFDASIALAEAAGVSPDAILKTPEDIRAYFEA